MLLIEARLAPLLLAAGVGCSYYFHRSIGQSPGTSLWQVAMRKRLAKFEKLESRNLLAAAVINEILYDELFGDANTSQYVELRGEPNASLDQGTYLVVVDSEENLNNIEGTIHGIFDLSGLSFGSNGFLVLLPQGSPYIPDPAATTLRSTEEGFGGLPGDIYSDSHDQSDRIDFIFAGNTFFLIQTDVAPQLGDDIDADSDGFIDPVGVYSNWNVLDSISVMWNLSDGHGYGSIVFVNTNDVHVPEVTIAEGTTLVRVDGFGYVGRIGNSTGSSAKDWVGGTVKDLSGDQYYVRIAGDTHGRPQPMFLQGRALDSVGSENFTGAARIRFFEDANGNQVFDDGETPLAGAAVFADSNGNGARDNIETIIEPDGYEDLEELTNLTDGVSLSVADASNEIIGFKVRARQVAFQPEGTHVFSSEGVSFFNSGSRFRADFYRPAQSISIDVIGGSTTPTYGRLEAYDSDGNLLNMVRSAPLGDDQRQTITISRPTDEIAYIIAFSDQDHLNSSPFGSFDRFRFTVPEAVAVAGEDGLATLNYLDPSDYTILAFDSSLDDYVFNSPSFVIAKYENFEFAVPAEQNEPPVIDSAELSVAELSATGTIVGTITATDHPSQTLRYSLVSGADKFSIDANSGILRVRQGAQLNFESTPTITIEVRVTDNATSPLSSSREFTVQLTDINENPQLNNVQFQVDENAPSGTVIGTLSATDVDEGNNGLLGYRLIGTIPGQVVSINGLTGELAVNNSSYLDYETRTQVVVTVEVFDFGDPSLTDTAAVTLLLQNVNEPPTITTNQMVVGELAPAGTIVGTVQVTDPEPSQFHQFAWADGFTSDQFTINQDSGQIFVAEGASLSFAEQNEYLVDVTATDNGSPPLSSTKSVRIRLIDENNPPFIQDMELSVAENSVGGTVLGTITVEDPDVGQSHVYGIASGDGQAVFEVDNNSGEIRVIDGAELDFEIQSSWELEVQAWDSGFPSASSTRRFTITIEDVNEPPVVLLDNQYSIGEDAIAPTEVGQIGFIDPDQGDVATVAFVDSEFSGLFEIDESTGVITVADNASFDFESVNEYVLSLEVTDGVNPPVPVSLTITIEDRNEAPVANQQVDPIDAVAGFDFEFQLPADLVTDPDQGQSVTYTLESADGLLPEWIAFDVTTGIISGSPWNAEQGSYALVLTATDNGTPELAVEIPISLEVAFNAAPWMNIEQPLDVNADGNVRAIDALAVINYLNRSSSTDVPELVDFRPSFLDVNGNNRIEPIDALKIINFLNRGESEGEGEQSSARSLVPGLANSLDFGALEIQQREERLRRLAVDEALTELTELFE